MPASGTDLHAYFEARLVSGALDAALDLSVVEFDELAQLAGVTLTSLEASATAIALGYSVSWTSFHACDDRSFGGTHARVLRGRVHGGAWLFERHEPLPTHRDSADEF